MEAAKAKVAYKVVVTQTHSESNVLEIVTYRKVTKYGDKASKIGKTKHPEKNLPVNADDNATLKIEDVSIKTSSEGYAEDKGKTNSELISDKDLEASALSTEAHPPLLTDTSETDEGDDSKQEQIGEYDMQEC